MIWSRYNFLIETLERFFIYNSFTNNLIELTKSDYNILKRIKEKPSILNSSKSLNLKNQLLNEFIVFVDKDDDINVLRNRMLGRMSNSNHFTITIAPTMDCNMNCVYCFEKKNYEAAYMSDDIIDITINYIKNLCQNKELTIMWYGGEPLMGISQIQKISRGLRENNISFKSIIITNGTLLKNITTEFLTLIDCVEIQISIDGLSDTHNKRRLWSNNGNSFDVIIDGIKKITEYTNSISIIIRANIDKHNKGEYFDLCQYIFKQINYKKLSIYPGFIHTYSGFKDVGLVENNPELNREEKVEFYREQFNKYHNPYLYYYPNFIDTCMAITNSKFLISFNGNIFKCWEDINSNDRVISNIKKPNFVDRVLLSKYSNSNDSLYNFECQKCGYLPICGGGCPVKRMRNFYYDRSEDTCTLYKENIKEFITYHILMKEMKRDNQAIEICD